MFVKSLGMCGFIATFAHLNDLNDKRMKSVYFSQLKLGGVKMCFYL